MPTLVMMHGMTGTAEMMRPFAEKILPDGWALLVPDARFAHPAIGYDGYLYHCSESSSPDFHDMSLGDINTKNFWDLYYSYNSEKMKNDFKLMEFN